MRSSVRAFAPSLIKSCCADLWGHAGVRLLLGEALRPGGRELTERLLDRARLPPGARMLDVGCGAGSSLGLLSTRGLRCTGIDISVALASAAADSASVCVGDAEALPFTDGTFDGLLVECVLSALPDKRKTVAELGRLLPPGGVLLLSDVTVNGPLPEPLDSLAGWIACAAGALSITEYTGLLEDGGFRVLWAEDREDDLATLLAQVRRRLALFHGAVAAGLVDVTSIGFPAALMDVGEQMVTLAVEAVGDGTLGYAALLAGRT